MILADIVGQLLGYLMLMIPPYALASLGIMLGGRVGVFNVSGEGLMLLTASVAFLTTYYTGNAAFGILSSLAVGALFGAVFVIFSERLKINQFIVGLTMFILALGLGSFLYKLSIGVVLTPPRTEILPGLPIPFLANIPVIGQAIFAQNILVYITIVMTLALHYLLFSTGFGLSVRSIGESPRVADVLGVNVMLYRYLFTILGSMLIGLAGAYLPLCFTGSFTDTIVGGRGWIAIAITIFGRWSPLQILLGSLVFGGIDVINYWLQVQRVPIPYQFLQMLPFAVTLVILIRISKKAEMPLAIGRAYDREAIEE